MVKKNKNNAFNGVEYTCLLNGDGIYELKTIEESPLDLKIYDVNIMKDFKDLIGPIGCRIDEIYAIVKHNNTVSVFHDGEFLCFEDAKGILIGGGIYQDENLQCVLDNGHVAYVQEVNNKNHQKYCLVYASYDVVYPLHYLETKEIEMRVDVDGIEPNYSLEWFKYHQDDNGVYKRIDLSLENAYMLRKEVEDIETLYNTDNHPHLDLIIYSLSSDEYKKCLELVRAMSYIDELVFDVYSTNSNSHDDTLVAFMNNGFTPIVKYHNMGISYILTQLKNLYDKDISNLKHMLGLIPKDRFKILDGWCQ